MNENICIQRILDGDRDAYRELVERYQTGLIIHCENLLQHREEGEDVCQEAFIKAYQNLRKFSADKGKFSTWIYRIATNLCIDTLRKNKHKVHIKDIELYTEAVLPRHAEDEDIQRIRKSVEALEPPKYAAIIKAYFWEGKSYREIAKTYDTTTNTIGTWISRAKIQLKEELS